MHASSHYTVYKGRSAFIIVSKYFRIILFEMGKTKAMGMFIFLMLLQQAEILLAIPTYQTGEFLCVNQHKACKGVVHALSCSSLFPVSVVVYFSVFHGISVVTDRHRLITNSLVSATNGRLHAQAIGSIFDK